MYKDKEKERAYQKAKHKSYYQTHKDEIKTIRKAYRQPHRDEISARQKAYQQIHRDEIKDYHKSWHENKKLEKEASIALQIMTFSL